MKHKILFLLILLFSTTAFSQLQLELDLLVVDFNSNKKEGGATMKVYDGSNVVGSAVSASNGKVSLKVPANKMYKVEISKAGKVTRYIMVNAKGIDIELLQGASEPSVRTSISLFEKISNVDYSFIESNAITEFYFDGKSTSLAYNKASADRMTKKIEEVIATAAKTAGNNELQYQNKMKEGEAAATSQNYLDARTKFEQAQYFKPGDKLSIKRMDDMDKLVKADKISQIDGAVAGGEYDNLIQAAKTLKGQKKYQLAIDKYEDALKSKPGDQFALDEIDYLFDLIQKEKREKANESTYTAAMAAAEGLMKQKSYQAARDQYENALRAKTGDPLATTKLKEVMVLLDAAKGALEKKRKFDDAIIAGDQLFKDEKWTEAKEKYDEALTYEAASAYAKSQNGLIKNKLDELEKAKALQKQIDQLIADGTKSFNTEKWEEAKVKFTEVKKLDDKNEIAIEKLAAIQLKLDELKQNAELEAKFKKLVDEGDVSSKALKYEEAIGKYSEALTLKANAEVEKKKTDAENAFNKLKNQKETKEKFDLAMKEGDALLTANKLEEAKAKFTEAIGIDETAQLPKDKIKAIDEKILANKSAKEKEEQFNAAMEAGNSLRSSGKLEDAIAEYKKAEGIDKTKTEPAKKIKEVQDEITALAASKSAEEKAGKFNEAMEAGNSLRSSGKLEDAITEYKKAQEIDKTKTEPAAKIKEVQDEITALAASKSAEEKASKYNAAMEAGNSKRSSGKLEEAIAEYKKAQGIDNSKPEPELKIQEVQAEITALASSKSAEEKASKYNAAMEAGNSKRSSGKLEEAIAEYKKAQGIDDTKSEPAMKIQEIQNEIASKEMNSDELAYTELMTEALALEDSKSYQQAIDKYKRAQVLKPTENKPAQRIKALEVLLKDQEAQNAIDSKYNEAMKKGHNAMSDEDYLAAIKHFNSANKIKPDESEPIDKARQAEEMSKNKTSEEDALFEKMLLFAKQKMDEKDYVKAEELIKRAADNRSTDPRPIELQKELDRRIQNSKNYQVKMADAKDAFEKKNFDMALQYYNDAKVLMPNETKPDEGIAAVNKEKGLLERASKDDEIFLTTIRNAEIAMADKKYSVAIAEYEKAAALKPRDTTIEGKIAAIKKIMNELASAVNKVAMKTKFDGLVAKADNLFESSKWEEAKSKYEEANGIIANDSHVLSQIEKCTASINKNQKNIAKYKQLIADADKKYNSAEYQNAKELYQSALNINNKDSYPHSQLAKIDGVLNPVFADDGHLPNLGTPTDNSLLEGQALLERAARIRAHRSSTIFRDKDKDMDELARINTGSKTDENQATSVELKNKMQIQELVDIENDEWRRTVVDSVKYASDALDRLHLQSNKYDDFEGQEVQRIVNQKTAENEDLYLLKHQVFAENTEKVKKAVISEEDNLILKSGILYDKQIKTQAEIALMEIKVEENYIDDTADRKLVVDSVRGAQKALSTSDFEQSQRMIEKSMNIKEEVNQSNIIRESKGVEDDEAERQKSKELVTNHIKDVEAITEKGSKVPENNQAVIKENMSLDNERLQKAEKVQVEKNYEARKFVEDVANRKMVYTDKIANEIGANYPEGVSQESFQKNGNDGLPVAFITRRVVVTKGHGEVYVRTQTLLSVTYSKNGDPSSEYIWQKETSDAKLTRNF